MSEQLVSTSADSAEQLARHFDEMATRIRRNAGDSFGGAFVLLPPTGFGNPVSSLLLNSSNVQLLFWQALAQIANSETERIKNEQRQMR